MKEVWLPLLADNWFYTQKIQKNWGGGSTKASRFRKVAQLNINTQNSSKH